MDDRLKRLHYRATHRGTREADHLVGGFVEAHLNGLDMPTLAALEVLMDESDVDLVNWIMGRASPLPDGHRAILSRIIDFKNIK
jgi:antitoxin CptB